MESYDNHISGIRSYELHGDISAIAVIFKGGNEVYVFEEQRLGIEPLHKMKELAQSNEGLGRYFSKNLDIRKNYSSLYADAEEYKKHYRPTL